MSGNVMGKRPAKAPVAQGAVAPPPLFSRPIDADKLPELGIDISIAADADERALIAAANQLVGIARLEADFHLVKRGRTGVTVTGEVRAQVTQTCVVSLEPFDSDVIEEIDVDFEAPREAVGGRPRPAAQSAPVLDQASGFLDQKDPPDPIIDGKIDLGALASEFLVLGLDPYPKKPGTEFEPAADSQEPDDPSPFAVLRKLGEKP